MRVCNALDCGRPSVARQMCRRHYNAWVRAGGAAEQRRYARKTDTLEQRIRSGSRRVPSGCIEWVKGCNQFGYGYLNFRGISYRVHRAAFELAHGQIPDGMVVCHRCDNRRCLNVEHLFLGTGLDNMRDMTAKGRQLHGERHHSARITAATAAEIRRNFRSGIGRPVIAQSLGVSYDVVYRVTTNRSWKEAS